MAGFGFNAGAIVNGINNITSTIASGANLVSTTINSISAVGNAVDNLLGAVGIGGGRSGGGSSAGRTPVGGSGTAGGLSPTQWITNYVDNVFSENGILRFIYKNLFNSFQPDVSGYVLLFMAPPVLSGYLNLGNQNYDPTGTSFLTETTKLFPLLATNFTDIVGKNAPA